MAKKSAGKTEEAVAVIERANMLEITCRIRGTAPYVQEAFSQKVKDKLLADMATPKAEKKSKTARPPRNYDEDFEQAQHKAVGGWIGIPCTALRQGMVDACRTVNLVMVRAKMSIFVQPDGFDVRDGTPLVRLHSPHPPERTSLPVRNDNGSVDIRIRPMWREWYADVRIEFDADMIAAQSIVNLLDRTGRQVGIGAGRPLSKKSVGLGWGHFTVEQQEANA